MKTKKLLLCMLLSLVITSLTQVNVFASENKKQDTQENETNAVESIAKTTVDKNQEETEKTKLGSNMDLVLNNMASLATNAPENSESDEESGAYAVKSRGSANVNKNDLKYLSAIIFCEAGDQSYESKLAVANVILNRSSGGGTWSHVNTIKDVIYDRKWGTQFTPAYSSVNSMSRALGIYNNLNSHQGTWQGNYMEEAIRAAREALSGKKVIPANYYYFNSNVQSTKSKCKRTGSPYTIISTHIYF